MKRRDRHRHRPAGPLRWPSAVGPDRRLRLGRIALVGVSTVAVLSGVAAAAPSPRTRPGEAASPRAAYAALVAAARASNHAVAGPFSSDTPAQLNAWTTGFERAFGFPVVLQNVPGNALQIPPKILTAAPSGHGVVDLVQTTQAPQLLPIYDANDLATPNWTALEYKFPQLAYLRNHFEPHFSRENSPGVTQYCAAQGDSPLVVAYDKARVSPAELKGLTLQTLTEPRWSGEVGIDASGTVSAEFSALSGVGTKGALQFARALAANRAVPLVGSSAIVQAIASGQVALGIASQTLVTSAIAAGSPIGYVLAPFSPKVHEIYLSSTGICLVHPGVNNFAMAELFLAWVDTAGTYATVSLGGSQRIDAQEAKYFPLSRQLAKAGFSQSDLITIKTLTALNGTVTLAGEIAPILSGS